MKQYPKHSFSGGGVVVGPNGKVLVANQNGNSWSLPKGHIEEGEHAKTAAIREIKEEAGITKLKFIKELGTYDRSMIGIDGGEDNYFTKTITIFLCTTPELELKPIDPENPEARWVDSDKVEELLTHPKDREFYKRVLPEVKGLIKDI